MAETDAVLDNVRQICLSLPDTQETATWGKPHFRVCDKIFAGCGEEKGVPVIGFKLGSAHAAAVVEDPGFWPAPYVGHKGWVSMDARRVEDWDAVQELLLESYRLIAPRSSLAKLEGPERLAEIAKKPAKKPAKQPAKKPAKKPAEQPAKQPAKQTAEQSAGTAVEKATKKKVIEKATASGAKKAASKAAKRPAKKPPSRPK